MQLADLRLFTMLPWRFQSRGVAQTPSAESPRSPSLPCIPACCPLLLHSASQPLIISWWSHQPPLCPLHLYFLLTSQVPLGFPAPSSRGTHRHTHTTMHTHTYSYTLMNARMHRYPCTTHKRTHLRSCTQTHSLPQDGNMCTDTRVHSLHTVPWLKVPGDPH